MAESKSGSSSSSGKQQSSGGSGRQTSGSSESSGAGRSAAQKKSTDEPTGAGTDVAQRDAQGTAGLTAESEGVREDPDGTLVPEENAPGPEPVDEPTISAVDLRPRIEPKDRATFLGAVHLRHPDVDVPEEFQLFGESDGERDMETVELDAESVDVSQVISTNGSLVLRFDGDTKVLNGQQAAGFLMDARSASANIVM